MPYYSREANVVSKSSSEETPQGNYPFRKPYTEFTVATNKIQKTYERIMHDNQQFHSALLSCLAVAKMMNRLL